MINLEAIEKGSGDAISFGKEIAIQRFQTITGRTQAEGQALYEALLNLSNESFCTLNVSDDELISFISGEKLNAVDTPYGTNHMACLTLNSQGDRKKGQNTIVLKNLDKAFCFCGSFNRTKDPSRDDYADDDKKLLYPISAKGHCKASAIMLSLTPSMLMMGKDQLLGQITSGMYEFGKAVVLFDNLTMDNLDGIVVPNEEKRTEVKRATSHLKRFLIIDVEYKDVKHIESKFIEENNPLPKEEPKYMSLAVSDRVMTKPMASHEFFSGVIVDITNGLVTVEWDNKTRSILNMVEAMSRLMIKPKDSSSPETFGEYVLDGMDEKTVRILSAVGLDPVNVYSLVSFCRPSSPKSKGWKELLVHKLSQIGIRIKPQEGFKESEKGPKAFERASWFEAKLANDARFIVDIACDRFKISAGDVEEYIIG